MGLVSLEAYNHRIIWRGGGIQCDTVPGVALEEKRLVAFRLSSSGLSILDEKAETYGVTRTQVVRAALKVALAHTSELDKLLTTLQGLS